MVGIVDALRSSSVQRATLVWRRSGPQASIRPMRALLACALILVQTQPVVGAALCMVTSRSAPAASCVGAMSAMDTHPKAAGPAELSAPGTSASCALTALCAPGPIASVPSTEPAAGFVPAFGLALDLTRSLRSLTSLAPPAPPPNS